MYKRNDNGQNELIKDENGEAVIYPSIQEIANALNRGEDHNYYNDNFRGVQVIYVMPNR